MIGPALVYYSYMYACEHTPTCRDQDPTTLQRAWVGVCQIPGTCLVTTVTPVPPHTDAASSPEPSGGLGHSSSHQPLPLRPDQVPAGEWGLPVSSHPQTVGAHSPQTWPAAGLPCTSLCSGCRGPRPSSGRSACSLGWAFLLCGPGVCPPEEYGPREPPVSEQPPCPPRPGTLGRSLRFSSQDGLRAGAAMERRSGFCWCGHIPRRPLALYHVHAQRKEGHVHRRVLPECSPENRGTRPQEASVPTHLTWMNWKGPILTWTLGD